MIALMDDESKTLLYHKHIGAVRRVSQTFATNKGLQTNEVFAEAMSLYNELIADWEHKYDPTRSRPSTRIYFHLFTKLKDLYSRNGAREIPFSKVAAHELHQVRARPDRLAFLRLLSREARILVDTIINAPGEIIEDMTPKTKRRARNAVRAYMTERLSWPARKLDRAWAEVEECLP